MNDLNSRIEKLSDKQRELLIRQIRIGLENKTQEASFQSQSLVAFITGDEDIDQEGIRKFMKERLPDYMVPSAFVQVDDIPRLPNGKVNIQELSKLETNDSLNETSDYTAPRNPVEEQLVTIWEAVLGFSPIGIYDNFFEIGGDSIISIQINGKARNAGLVFPANQIFDTQTIAKLAAFVKIENQENSSDVLSYTGPIELTPIQKWFFETHKNAPDQWNQGVRFELPMDSDSDLFKRVVQLIISRHDALRLSFEKIEEQWHSSVAKVEQLSVFESINLDNLTLAEQQAKINATIKKVSSSFRLSEGNLFRCLYFQTGDSQKDQVVLIAHHLVVDNVSWQIITNELSTAIEQLQNKKEVDLGVSSITYHQWSDHLRSLIQQENILSSLDYWNGFKKEIYKIPALNQNQKLLVSEKDLEIFQITLNASDTERLTKEITETYHTKVNEVLLTAFVRAWREWTGNTSLIIETEGHGREALGEDTTFFNSVGWFTSVFPIQIDLEENQNIFDDLKRIKTQIRNVPHKGLSYGLLRYLDVPTSDEFSLNYQTPVLFNYLGIQNHLVSDVLGQGENLANDMRHPESEQDHLLEFNALIINHQLIIKCRFSPLLIAKEELEKLMKFYQNNIQLFFENGSDDTTHHYTPSDFTDVDISQNDLDALMDQF